MKFSKKYFKYSNLKVRIKKTLTVVSGNQNMDPYQPKSNESGAEINNRISINVISIYLHNKEKSLRWQLKNAYQNPSF